MKNLPLLFVFFLLLAACKIDLPDTSAIRQRLFEKLLQDEAFIAAVQTQSNVYLLSSDQCNTDNCQDYFLNAGLNLPIYTKEEAFMRNLSNSIIIQDIDLSTQVPFLEYQINLRHQKVRSVKVVL